MIPDFIVVDLGLLTIDLYVVDCSGTFNTMYLFIFYFALIMYLFCANF